MSDLHEESGGPNANPLSQAGGAGAAVVDEVIFHQNGTPMRFFFHSSITPGQAADLTHRITTYGGTVTKNLQESTVVLCSRDHLDDLRLRHSLSDLDWKRDIHVESMRWIKQCIERDSCQFSNVLRKAMPGPPPSRARVPFTKEDEERLCRFLARRIPHSEAGGRLGEVIYKELVSLATRNVDGDNAFEWVARHTWQSWKEHYKKNKEQLDSIIDAIAKEEQPRPDVWYHRTREANKRRIAIQGRRVEKPRRAPRQEDEESSEDEHSEVSPVPPSREARRRQREHARPSEERQELSSERRRMEKAPQQRERSSSSAGGFYDPQAGADLNAASPDHIPDDDNRVDIQAPGRGDPGPSGTQHSPSAARVHPRSGPVSPELSSLQAGHAQVPTSSQATLIATQAPVSSTPRRVTRQQQKLSEPTLQDASQNIPRSRLQPQVGRGAAKRTVPDDARDAPYRNTRARSRSASVEPQPVSRTMGARQRRRSSAKQNMSTVVEQEPEPESLGPVTYEEERLVERQLLVRENSGVVSGHDKLANPERESDVDMDSDDAQTHRSLAHPPDSKGDSEEEEQRVLKALQRHSSRTRSHIAHANLGGAMRPAIPARVPRRDRTPPLRDQRGARGASVHSSPSDVFPTPGTRAQKERQRRDALEKLTPYSPPLGTRAAKLKQVAN